MSTYHGERMVTCRMRIVTQWKRK